MKKALAMKWVEALRSGKYKQGARYLKKNGRYCCLGVLCEITGFQSLSDKGLSDLGNPISSGLGDIDSLHTSLAQLNDRDYTWGTNLNFDEIADIIQIFYKEL